MSAARPEPVTVAQRVRRGGARAIVGGIAEVQSLLGPRAWIADLALIALVTAAGAALRLALLGDVPYGLHPDEAQVGLDAHRIMEEGWIGVYTPAALGQPSGHAYLTTPSIWLLGDNVFALRLPLALAAVAAVPLLYAFVRTSFGRVEAFFGAALLALSYWHLLYSRVAHWSISYGTVVLGVLLCVMLGLRQRRWQWFVAAGALLGAGVYTYNIYPIAVVAVAVFLGFVTFMKWRSRDDFGWWTRSVGAMAGVALAVAMPFLVYIADPDALYWDHIGNYSEVGVARSEEFEDASARERVELIAEQAWTFARSYTYDADPDIVDAAGIRPVFDPITLALIVFGLALAWRHKGEPAIVAALCCMFIIPLPAVLQQGSIMRQPVAAAPFAMFVAALPLAFAWRTALEQPRWRLLSFATVGVAVAGIATLMVRDYFWTWRSHSWTDFIYHADVTTAAQYMERLPDGTYVYFYSDRAPISLETIRFLAPDAEGEDRSSEFSNGDGSIGGINRSRDVAFVLLGPYQELIDEVAARYPGGRTVEIRRRGAAEVRAYELDAQSPDGAHVEPP